MMLQKIIDESSIHFSIHALNRKAKLAVINHYINDHLKIASEDSEVFMLINEVIDKKNIDDESYQDFMLWYFMHYMAIKSPIGQYTATLYPDKIKRFVSTRIDAVKLMVDAGQIKASPCEPDVADFWTVSIGMIDGSFIAIIDCINQEEAQNAETFIHAIGKNFFVGL